VTGFNCPGRQARQEGRQLSSPIRGIRQTLGKYAAKKEWKKKTYDGSRILKKIRQRETAFSHARGEMEEEGEKVAGNAAEVCN
jgi:hypothetical protein